MERKMLKKSKVLRKAVAARGETCGSTGSQVSRQGDVWLAEWDESCKAHKQMDTKILEDRQVKNVKGETDTLTFSRLIQSQTSFHQEVWLIHPPGPERQEDGASRWGKICSSNMTGRLTMSLQCYSAETETCSNLMRRHVTCKYVNAASMFF